MDTVKIAINRLRARLKDPKLFLVPGLSDDLASIAAALQSVDRRLESLERCRDEKTKAG